MSTAFLRPYSVVNVVPKPFVPILQLEMQFKNFAKKISWSGSVEISVQILPKDSSTHNEYAKITTHYLLRYNQYLGNYRSIFYNNIAFIF